MQLKPIISKEAERVLKDIINNEPDNNYWRYRFAGIEHREDIVLRGCFKELQDNGLIKVLWADNIPYNIIVLKDGYMYSEYDDPKRAKLKELLDRAEDIKAPINATYDGGPNLGEYNQPSAIWINDAAIFIERNLHDHPLYEQMKSEIFHKKGRAYSGVKNCLTSVLADDDYWNDVPEVVRKQLDSSPNAMKQHMYDVFISHANSDKQDFVDELNASIEKLGIDIFYDKNILEWGDKWKEKIIEGTKKARYAIIVISENFFGREWTENELDIFMHRENESGQKLILPIIHNITMEQLRDRYPNVAEIQAIDSSKYSTDEIALKFAKVLLKGLKEVPHLS